MDALEFIADLVRSLSWPTAIAVLAVVILRTFRNPLAGILDRIGELSYEHRGRKFLALFQQKAEAVQEQIRQAEPAEGEPVVAQVREFVPPEGDTATEAGQTGMGPDFFELFESVAQAMPVAAVPVAWARLEHEVRATAEAFGINNVQGRNIRNLVVALREVNAIGDSLYQSLRALRDLRNMATHEWGLVRDLTYDQVHTYLVAVQHMTRQLNRARANRDPDSR